MTDGINKFGKLIAGIFGTFGILLAIIGMLMAYGVIKDRNYFLLLGLVVPFMMAFFIIITIAIKQYSNRQKGPLETLLPFHTANGFQKEFTLREAEWLEELAREAKNIHDSIKEETEKIK